MLEYGFSLIHIFQYKDRIYSKLLEVERHQHKLGQDSRRECLDFSVISTKDLGNLAIRVSQETGVERGRLQIVASHRLEKTDKAIVKFLNGKYDETVFLNKKN